MTSPTSLKNVFCPSCCVLCFVTESRNGCVSENIFVSYSEDLLSKVYETSGNVGKENVLRLAFVHRLRLRWCLFGKKQLC